MQFEKGELDVTKVIILAAGQGSRLRPYTNNLPKCLVELKGKSLLDYQLEALNSLGIHNLHIVCGYLSEKINRIELQKHYNPDYASTNMVYTLFCAREIMTGQEDLIITYGDIVYSMDVMQSVVSSNAPMTICVDRSWRRYWEARMDDPLSDAETLRLGSDNKIVEIGKKPSDYNQIEGQYTGIIKIRSDYVEKFRRCWEEIDRNILYDGNTFKNMYMTSYIQYLINAGWDVRATFVDNGWLEIDTPDDLLLDFTAFLSPSR